MIVNNYLTQRQYLVYNYTYIRTNLLNIILNNYAQFHLIIIKQGWSRLKVAALFKIIRVIGDKTSKDKLLFQMIINKVTTFVLV